MTSSERQWSPAQAADWYRRQPWLVGANFIPSTAVNQLEMWQAGTFDAGTIDRELGWAADIGMNTMRVFLHDLLWDAEPEAFRARIDEYLRIATGHGVRTLFVLFDDCWNDGARLGPQPAPVPARHNSGWLQSPGHAAVGDPAALPRLEEYVRGVVRAFASDDRVLGWDLYNEVTNGFMADNWAPPERRAELWREAAARRAESMHHHVRLLDLAFGWARGERPSQPLTAGVWIRDRDLSARLVERSDIITFHNYEDTVALEAHIGRLRRFGRPLICTEWLARTRGSEVATHLPIFKRENVGCYNWGLVNGRTQTHIAWTGESDVWFHDLFHADGAPYDAAEAAAFRQLTGRATSAAT